MEIQRNEVTPRLLVILIGMVLLFVAFYLSIKRVDVFLKDSAITSCAQQSRFDRKDGNNIISYPIDNFYKECLKQKGIN